jgi:4a-hydroxytetrahydrobiopterin dehydratase
VARIAERRDHHPDIDVRYSKVRLTLSTHSAGGLTVKDFASAKEYGALYGRRSAPKARAA